MKQRLISLMIALFLLAAAVLPVSAAQNEYHPQAALSYAEEHWCDGVGQCAEFVSACLNAGGCTAFAKSCSDLVAQLRSSGLCTEYTVSLNADRTLTVPSDKILTAGDAVFYYCTAQGEYQHAVLCAGADSDGYMRAYSHNNARNGTSKYFYSPRCPECGCASVTYVTVMHFTVNDAPGKPELNVSGTRFAEAEPIRFTWAPTQNTTHYNLFIERENDEGCYEQIAHEFYVSSGCTLSFERGNYRVKLQSVNADAPMTDGTVWKYTNAKLCTFTVTRPSEEVRPEVLPENHEIS